MTQGYELILLPLASEIPVDVRLQHVLKSLLRSYRFQCKSVRPVELKKKTAKKARKRKDLDQGGPSTPGQRHVSERF